MNRYPAILSTAMTAILVTACSSGSGGGGGGGGSDVEPWTDDGRVMEISDMTLNGTTDEPADIVVNGDTVTARGTIFQFSSTPAEMGIDGVLQPGGDTLDPSWTVQATDIEGNQSNFAINPVLEP